MGSKQINLSSSITSSRKVSEINRNKICQVHCKKVRSTLQNYSCHFKYSSTISHLKIWALELITFSSSFLTNKDLTIIYLLIQMTKNSSRFDLQMIFCSKRWDRPFKIQKCIRFSQISHFHERKVSSKLTVTFQSHNESTIQSHNQSFS